MLPFPGLVMRKLGLRRSKSEAGLPGTPSTPAADTIPAAVAAAGGPTMTLEAALARIANLEGALRAERVARAAAEVAADKAADRAMDLALQVRALRDKSGAA